LFAASAGIVPAQAQTTSPGDAREVDSLAMVARLGGRLSWWAALGRDAGALARKALSKMPLDAVTAGADISRRRRDARDALGAARVSLWTTDAEGFEVARGNSSEGHAIVRTIRVVDLGR